MVVAEIDYITKASEGTEVEELSKKEIHKALRIRISVEQLGMESEKALALLAHSGNRQEMLRAERRPTQDYIRPRSSNPPPRPMPQMSPRPAPQMSARPMTPMSARPGPTVPNRSLSEAERKTLKEMSEDLIGTRGAYILDEKLNIHGKVPIAELQSTVGSLGTAYAVVFDGIVDKEMLRAAEKANVRFLVAMDAKIRPEETKMGVLTVNEL